MHGLNVIVQAGRTSILLPTAALSHINLPIGIDGSGTGNLEKFEQVLSLESANRAIGDVAIVVLPDVQHELLDERERGEAASAQVDSLRYVLSVSHLVLLTVTAPPRQLQRISVRLGIITIVNTPDLVVEIAVKVEIDTLIFILIIEINVALTLECSL
jgi:hypothetical protein